MTIATLHGNILAFYDDEYMRQVNVLVLLNDVKEVKQSKEKEHAIELVMKDGTSFLIVCQLQFDNWMDAFQEAIENSKPFDFEAHKETYQIFLDGKADNDSAVEDDLEVVGEVIEIPKDVSFLIVCQLQFDNWMDAFEEAIENFKPFDFEAHKETYQIFLDGKADNDSAVEDDLEVVGEAIEIPENALPAPSSEDDDMVEGVEKDSNWVGWWPFSAKNDTACQTNENEEEDDTLPNNVGAEVEKVGWFPKLTKVEKVDAQVQTGKQPFFMAYIKDLVDKALERTVSASSKSAKAEVKKEMLSIKGQLGKSGSKMPLNFNWYLRYFEVEGTSFTYFKSKDSTDLKEYKIEKDTIIKVMDEETAVFQIKFAEKKFVLMARDTVEMHSWVNTLKFIKHSI
ncbi:hypothetical protein O9G_006006 [Rozella allomycis CSF55]|uniref:PH domain-containing protein n=1 Tax=Rozella allomycis (strain CSF55) TaxID=988480 RepID=A0A075AUZ5_ROZAC|nr:hypothetical protein O9G_006006 [Rozella allomycis CSF55]|eukprot:EPZ33990.1 hypothetical protein O9G_006006 [Rozella allomycis CSF55]